MVDNVVKTLISASKHITWMNSRFQLSFHKHQPTENKELNHVINCIVSQQVDIRLPCLGEHSNHKSSDYKNSWGTKMHPCTFHWCGWNCSNIFSYILSHTTVSKNQHSHNVDGENYSNLAALHHFSTSYHLIKNYTTN